VTRFSLIVRDTFAVFTWDMPLVEREGWGLSYPAEPAALLEYGMIERDVRHWDFARLAHF